MDVIAKLIETLSTNKHGKMLNFGGRYLYFIEEKLGHGEQGLVIKMRNNIGKHFALKAYRPTGSDAGELKEGVKRFIREVKTLSNLNHKNIVKIFSAGTAQWDEGSQEWQVKEGFEEERIDPEPSRLYYYIMEYIRGHDLSSIFPQLKEKSRNLDENSLCEDEKSGPNTEECENHKGEGPLSDDEKVNLFEQLITQVCSAIRYYHSKDITHKDIKPSNIRYCSEDGTFIIVDFGFAHSLTSKYERKQIKRTQYFDWPSVSEGDYRKNDIAQLSMMLLDILPTFESTYGEYRYSGLKNAFEKAVDDKLENRYEDITEFYDSVKEYFLAVSDWKLLLRVDEPFVPNAFRRFKFSFKLRIPVSGSILLSEEIKRIIDCPEFQRLRGTRQLGPAIFVFPGANHTRFEHSLGTYFLALRYLEKLLTYPAFREAFKPLEESVKLVLLSCLLHDIGHYPYSHWVEEIDEFPRRLKIPTHEDRALAIICGEGRLKRLIADEWDLNPQDICNIISGEISDDNLQHVVINSIIDSIIDVDKVDYLIRDSVHCGVNYGLGIDIERLLDSIYLEEGGKTICLTDKGTSCLMSILACRNIMYHEVYWHKTVRACDAMFKRFLYEYIRKEVDDGEKVQNYFYYSDDHFITKLTERVTKVKANDLVKLISPFTLRGRELYKPAYIFSYATKEAKKTEHFFSEIFERGKSYKNLVDVSNKLVKVLRPYIPGIKNLDIIIDITPIEKAHEIYELKGFKIWNIRKKVSEPYPEEIDSLNNYLENTKQAYIFCHPVHYQALKKLASTNKFSEILGEI